MFKEDQAWQHRAEARQMVAKFGKRLALVVALCLYLTVGKALGVYDWRVGILSVVVIALIGANMIVVIARWHKLRLAPTCPVCGGLFSVDEKVLRGNSADGLDSLPPIIDRISTCESCGRQHHRVYAATGESGAILPITLRDSLSSVTHSPKSILQIRFPGKSDQEIDQMVAEMESYQKSKTSMTRAEWERLLEKLQQEAEMKNREQRMELPKKHD